MASPPRVAVVGGGIAGSLCALVLKSRGAAPTIFDMGKSSVGGRMGQLRSKASPGDSGVQFLRVSDDSSQFAQAVRILSAHGLVAPWQGRFGLLGSRGGGFLPKEIISSTAVTRLVKHENEFVSSSDSDDFCGFISGPSSSPLLVGVPSMHHICEGLCSSANFSVLNRVQVVDVFLERDTCTWSIVGDRVGTNANRIHESGFQAVVLATHDPSFAARVVRQISTEETEPDGQMALRLRSLASALQDLRDNHSSPVLTLSAVYSAGSVSDKVPFDAAGCPTSPHFQLLVREASKPGREKSVSVNEEVWTAVSTSSFARELLRRHKAKGAIAEDLASEFAKLLTPFFDGQGAVIPSPLRISVKAWPAGFTTKSLGLKEDCVSLEPWRLAVCGDFLRNHSTPIESAALSGMEAAERVAAWFSTTENEL